MLTYRFDPQRLDFRETANDNDVEFLIRVPDDSPELEALRKVQRFFESNDDFTDVLFYAYPDHEFKVIVRREHYGEFLTELFKRRLLTRLAWTD